MCYQDVVPGPAAKECLQASSPPTRAWPTLKSIEKLAQTRDLSELARLLGYRPSGLSYILHKIPDTDKYHTFTIPKKNGGEREISAPQPRLKTLQRRLASLLQQCFEEAYGEKTHGRALSHGFRRKHSIISNACNHRNRRHVFNIDLSDFFPSINFGRVRGFFIKSNDFELNPKVATVIAQIACHNNELPQGSPLSPVLSNLIGHLLDIRLVRLAKKAKCSYSRYADDITFSTRAKEFPAALAQKEASGEWIPGAKLVSAVERAGFRINPRKVSMQYQTQRQMVTGLVVNRKVNVRAEYYRQARAMCDALFRTGQFHIGTQMRWGQPESSPTPVAGTVNRLRGVLDHIYDVKLHHDRRDLKDRKNAPTGIVKLFGRFLHFDRFHSLVRPLILCEGKSDSIYLRCALRALTADYPRLIEVSESGPKWRIDFFKYSKRTMELMSLSGGTGDLARLICHYREQMAPFLCPGKAHPVLLVVDSDSGASEVRKQAARILTVKVDGNDPFYHLVENLYLVLLPLPEGKAKAAIEDYFEESVRKTRLGEKSFNPDEKSFDKAENYGKHVFADKVVKAQQASIDFAGFRPLLERIDSAIADYAARGASQD
jgi:RNA-directed DNA polymerase